MQICFQAKELFDEYGLDILPWTGNSPDFNIIENVWSEIKRKLSSKTLKTKEELKEAVLYIWNNEITLDFIKKLYESIPKRVKACLKAKGGSTRY
jgi:transposase